MGTTHLMWSLRDAQAAPACPAHAAMHGKYSPDIEDVRAVALPILAHRIVKNYKAEAEGISIAAIVTSLL